MPSFRIVLVEPKSQGNVGSVARVLKNFGQAELAIVGGPELGDEARGRALHAWDVASAARRHKTLEDALEGCDYIVGTTARIPDPESTYLRNPIEAHELPTRLAEAEGKIALLFGREDFGLFNSEIELCDLLVTIPTSDAYRSLNLAQAVAIVAYELYVQRPDVRLKQPRQMSAEMRAHFQQTMDRLIDAMDLPEHQAKNTKTAYRKLFGRAMPSAWEYFVMMGIFRRCLEQFGIKVESGTWEPDFEIPSELGSTLDDVLDATR